MNIRFIVDSTFNLSSEIIEKYNISVVPLNVIINGESFRDGIDINFDEVLVASENGKKVTTSQPAPGLFLTYYEKLKSEGATDIICLTMSSTLSGTYQSAILAKKEIEDINIHVIDTLSTSIGAEMIMLLLLEEYEKGIDIDSFLKKAEELRSNTTIMMSMRNLNALRRSGRLSRIKATLGNLLGVKAIIEYIKGKVFIETKSRTENGVIDAIVKKMKDTLEYITGKIHIFVAHVGSPELLHKIEEKINAVFPKIKVELRNGITPVIAVNLGYGGFGIAWCYES